MKLFKTMAYFSLTPNFTDFITYSTEARALYEFVKPIISPEEAFYGTLLHYWNWSNSKLNASSILIIISQGRIQDFRKGGSKHYVRAQNFGHAHKLINHAP